MTAPAWLEQHLQAIGVADSAGLAGAFRTARLRHCLRGCGALVVCGLDDDVCALPATCDPSPLDHTGELAALLAGFRTYSLDDKSQLWFRDADAIKAKWRGTILPEHKCGQPATAATEMTTVKYTTPEIPEF